MVSVVMTTYNGEKYLREQLDSIYIQTLLPFEVIVCDDCSTDSTVEILSEYRNKFGLKYFVNEVNLGYVRNFERAINLSSGNYFALCDQDDVWFNNKLEVLYSRLLQLEKTFPDKPILLHSDAVVTDSHLNVISNKFIGKRGEIKGLNKLLFGNHVVQGAACLFNSKFKEIYIPFPKEVQQHDLYASFLIETAGIRYYMSDILMFYRQHSDNLLGANNRFFFRRLKNVTKFNFKVSNSIEIETLKGLQQKYFSILNQTDIKTIKNFFFIINRNSFFLKVNKTIESRFNSNGSCLKLLLKILVNQFK